MSLPNEFWGLGRQWGEDPAGPRNSENVWGVFCNISYTVKGVFFAGPVFAISQQSPPLAKPRIPGVRGGVLLRTAVYPPPSFGASRRKHPSKMFSAALMLSGRSQKIDI